MLEEKKPNPVDIYVGSRLRTRRNLLGLSQNKMGDLIGVTFQQIQKYEKGVNRMGSSRLYQISKILLVPVTYFFDGCDIEIENEAPYEKDNVDNKEIAHLIKNFIRITNLEIRKSIIALTKSLIDEAGDEKGM